MNKNELIKRIDERLAGSSKHTISQFKAVISRFYDFSKGDFTRASVVKYIQKLERDGYAPGTRKTHYRIIKRGFEFVEVPWPFGKRPPSELPIEVAEWDVERIPIAVEDVEAMVTGAKNGTLSPAQVALLCASTVYGLRRIELVELSSELLDLENGRLRIVTAKHGRSREHLIPEMIKLYLKSYPFGKYNEFGLSQAFHQIRQAVGLPRVEGMGWHSIRRTIDTLLLNVLPLPVVRDYLRWKKSSMEMALVYWTPLSVEEIDKQVFEVHPFLPFWG